MGTSGYILKKKEKYVVENMTNDMKIAVFKANLNMGKPSIVNHDDGSFYYLSIGISDDIAFNLDLDNWGNEEVDQGQMFSFCINEIDEIYEDDTEFDWVIKDAKLRRVGYIEEVRDSEEIIFKFIYEYLKLNPEDCLWVEEDWVYTLDDIERLSKLPFDECWCYKNPNDRDTI